MKYDVSLITGIFLGSLIGVVYVGHLTPYVPFLIIGSVVMLLKHIKA